MDRGDYSWILSLPRQVGHTAAACGERTPGCVVVAPDRREAERLEREYGVKALGLDDAWQVLHGQSVPVVFDLAAVQAIVRNQREWMGERLRKAVEWCSDHEPTEHLLKGLALGESLGAVRERWRRERLERLVDPQVGDLADFHHRCKALWKDYTEANERDDADGVDIALVELGRLLRPTPDEERL